MVPEFLSPKRVGKSAVQRVEDELGHPLPPDYVEFVRRHGVGGPTPPTLRVPAEYRGLFPDDEILWAHEFTAPAKSRIARTTREPGRTFLSIATRDQYHYLLEVTPGGSNGVYYWFRHPAEYLDEAFDRDPNDIETMSTVRPVASSFTQFISSFDPSQS